MNKFNLQKAHEEFEGWAEKEPYFGYADGDEAMFDKCSSGFGYTDAAVHAAWMGFIYGKYGKIIK